MSLSVQYVSWVEFQPRLSAVIGRKVDIRWGSRSNPQTRSALCKNISSEGGIICIELEGMMFYRDGEYWPDEKFGLIRYLEIDRTLEITVDSKDTVILKQGGTSYVFFVPKAGK